MKGSIQLDRPLPTKRIGLAIVVVGLLVARWVVHPAMPVSAPPAASPDRPWGQSPFGAGRDEKSGPLRPVQRPVEPREQAVASRREEVARLVATGRPDDAYAAYSILRACALARRLESKGQAQRPPASAICSDLAPDQLVSRTQLLEKAGAAGVRGAFWSFLADGPDGIGPAPMGTADEMRDPVVADYLLKVRVYQEAAARKGDRVALMGMSTFAENEEHDLPKSLAYWVAQEQVAQAQSSKASPSYDAVVANLSARMTPEQAAAAVAEGMQMSSAARASECNLCATPVDVELLQPDLIEKLRQQIASMPLPWTRETRFEPGETFTECIGSSCRTLGYQAAGLWLPVKSTLKPAASSS